MYNFAPIEMMFWGLVGLSVTGFVAALVFGGLHFGFWPVVLVAAGLGLLALALPLLIYAFAIVWAALFKDAPWQ